MNVVYEVEYRKVVEQFVAGCGKKNKRLLNINQVKHIVIHFF